jgi:hypothetical protein
MSLKDMGIQEEKYTLIATLLELFDQINVNYLEDPDAVIEDCLYSIAGIMVINHKDDSKSKVLERFVICIIRKIVEIFAIRTKRADSLSFISKLLTKKGILLYKTKSYMYPSYSNSVDKEPNSFYH